MTVVWTWFASGGYVMIALAALAALLCFLIFERLLATGAQMRAVAAGCAPLGEPASRAMRLSGLRRMGLIRACIVVAPLLGLLGTVTGIVNTFGSILQGGYVTEMSKGIRQALVTTQYGLAIAASGLLAEQVLLRRVEKLTSLFHAARIAGREVR
ncbi:MAG: MotA/TolQ/ExbB proton channel family protein [Phycisphaerae bacterium]